MRRLPAALAVLALTATTAVAQDREPAQRQTMTDLAYILGEAHALRQTCAPNDQYWRGRMMAMVETENGDHGFAERLRQSFNTGYIARQSQYPNCSGASRQAETEVANRGAALARRMGSTRIRTSPSE